MNAAPQTPSGTDNDNDAPKGKGVATASSGGGLGELQQFLLDTVQEFKKISWPSRQQVIQETWTVLVLVSVITGAVLGFDYAIAKVVFEPLDKLAKHMGGGVGMEREQAKQTKWAPLTPQPGTPTSQPGAPADTPATPPAQQAPAGQPSGSPAPGATPPANNAPAPSTTTPAPAAPAGKPTGSK